jgi:hypothetical protein
MRQTFLATDEFRRASHFFDGSLIQISVFSSMRLPA